MIVKFLSIVGNEIFEKDIPLPLPQIYIHLNRKRLSEPISTEIEKELPALLLDNIEHKEYYKLCEQDPDSVYIKYKRLR